MKGSDAEVFVPKGGKDEWVCALDLRPTERPVQASPSLFSFGHGPGRVSVDGLFLVGWLLVYYR